MVNPTSTPKTAAELEETAMELWEQIQNIQLQLRDPSRAGETAKERPDFLIWRQKAKTALDMKVRLYRKTMKQIKALRGGPMPKDPYHTELDAVVRTSVILAKAVEEVGAEIHASRIHDALQHYEEALSKLRGVGYPVDAS